MSQRKFFPGSNSYTGFYSYFDNIWLDDTMQRIILKGGPGTGKSTLMKKISQHAAEHGYDTEEFWCSSDPSSMDALTIPQKNVGLVDGTAPHQMDPVYPGVRDHLLSLGDCWEPQFLQKNKDDIVRLKKMNQQCFHQAYHYFAESYAAYQSWKYFCQLGCNTQMIQQESHLLAQTFLTGASSSFRVSRHLFAAAITPEGPIDFVETLFTPQHKIWGLKGGPGSGVKTILQNIADQAALNSIYLEIYHCPFVPKEIDILIEPQSQNALIDISSPIVHYMLKLGDSDFKGTCNTEGFYDALAVNDIIPPVNEAQQRFLNLLKSGILMLEEAKKYHDQLEDFYIQAMQFEKIDKKIQSLIDQFLT